MSKEKFNPGLPINDTEKLVKVVTGMGYTEHQARFYLAKTKNNVEQAIQFLVEGDKDKDKQRRLRRRYKVLRNNLMGNPDVTNYSILRLVEEQQKRNNGEAMRDLINNRSLEFMESLLDSSSSTDEEEEGSQQEASSASSPSEDSSPPPSN